MGGAFGGSDDTSEQLVPGTYSWMLQSTHDVYFGSCVGVCSKICAEEFTRTLAEDGERVTAIGVGPLEDDEPPPHPAKPKSIKH